MPFVKLDCGMVDSTIICEPGDAFKAWIILLLKAGPDGVASITAPVLAKLCDCSLSRMEEILESYIGPEKHSRTSDNDGARISRVEGGYLILNYEKYRAKDYSSTERSRRFREKQRLQKDATPLHTVPTVTGTQAEAEAYVYKKERRAKALPTDFRLNPERVAFATKKGIQNVEQVMENFLNYHTAKGSLFKNWDAAWRTWCGKERLITPLQTNYKISDEELLQRCQDAGISTVGRMADELQRLLAAKRI